MKSTKTVEKKNAETISVNVTFSKKKWENDVKRIPPTNPRPLSSYCDGGCTEATDKFVSQLIDKETTLEDTILIPEKDIKPIFELIGYDDVPNFWVGMISSCGPGDRIAALLIADLPNNTDLTLSSKTINAQLEDMYNTNNTPEEERLSIAWISSR